MKKNRIMKPGTTIIAEDVIYLIGGKIIRHMEPDQI
jgi:hypothetical protein